MADLAYSARAQPFLDAIASAVFSRQDIRDWLVTGTSRAPAFLGARSLHDEQARLRPGTKQPFWANLWCGRDGNCTCRIPGSRALETDALFLTESASGERLAIHVEFKHPREPLRPGQAEGYALRAACWADRTRCPRRVPQHDAWLTVIFCDNRDLDAPSLAAFDRQITHQDAAAHLPGYPLAKVSGHHV